MLSETAELFRSGYIAVMINEALDLTADEDKANVIVKMEAKLNKWTFQEIAKQAINDGFISSMDEIYAE